MSKIACTHEDGGCDALAEVDKTVREAEQALAKAKERRRVLAETLNSKRDRFIQGMPPEIATMIFASDLELNLMDDPSRPLKLSAVCKRWRQLAFGSQELWATMICQRKTWPWRFPVDLVEPWFSRAGVRRMDITVSWDAHKQIGGPMGPALSRNGMNYLAPLFTIIEAHRASVKSFKLVVPSTVLDLIKDKNFENFDNAKQMVLRLLSCSFFEISSISRFRPTDVTIDGHLTPYDTLKILRRCRNRLTSCKLQTIHTPRSPIPAEALASFELPHLEELHLFFRRSGGADAPQLFVPLQTPVLRTLSIHLSHTSDAAMALLFFPAICTFIERVADTLTSLSLMIDKCIPEEQMVALLKGLPKLDTLHLQFSDHLGVAVTPAPKPSGALLRAIARHEEGTDLFLPQLKELRLRGTISSWKAVTEIFAVHSKADALRPLKSIDLTPSRRHGLHVGQYVLGKSTLQRLLVLPQNGLKFTLSNSSLIHDSILFHKLKPGKDVLAYYDVTLRSRPMFNFLDDFDPFDLADFPLLY